MPKAAPAACPECGTTFDKVDPYKHAVTCLHLAGHGPSQDLKELTSRRDSYAEHVRAILEPLVGKEA